MKLILIKDVKGMGRAHDEITTSDGYALNYLIPKKFAIAATIVAKQEAETRRKQSGDRSVLDAALLTQNIISLSEAHIVIKMKANEKGHLYDAVAAPDIVRAAKEQAHIDVPQEAIKIEKPIKEVGTFEIPVTTAGAFGKFSITIEAE
ncbi:MAG TPA: 50S ribosomal protein L9 [Candidatus Paceibacterota bacterium]|nr:50S ribosomal protein L9 [Candidatus Paceibacterota bacterium]